MTPRYTEALNLAARAHEGQARKGTPIPYITHDQQIAALLHDVLEDGGPQFAPEIEDRFGVHVLAMVDGCTDGTPDATGQKAPWAQRKQAYSTHLAAAPDDTLLVSACDKLSNARAILDDLVSLGPTVFAAKKDGTLWYYEELAKVFTARRNLVAEALSSTVAEVKWLAG